MPTPHAMFRVLSVTCLLTRKARLAHVLNDERFCISTVYIIRMSFSASNNFIIDVTVVVPRVCVHIPVRSFLPPRASRLRRTCSPWHRKLFYIL